ncbi:MAG TPA: PepSY domain-containing protein [Caulobacteraceae bacterium]|nr:PepSY domain-containing protein [Caulobacteraceae bacterium]
MKRNVSAAGALALAVLSGGAAAEGFGGGRLGGTDLGAATFRGHQLAGHARLSLGQARAAALKVRPGALVDQELEKETGGSGLRYSFDILSGGKIFEVGVDAKTGKILENDIETAAEGAAEH